MATDEQRESFSPALLFWTTASKFLEASKKLGAEPLPARYVACHGMEMAIKAHLRAQGYTVKELIGVGHSLCRAMSHAVSTGMEQPPDRVQRVFAFAEEIHFRHEYRYPHLYKPAFIESHHLVYAGAWALHAAAPAVVRAEPTGKPHRDQKMLDRMFRQAAALTAWAEPRLLPGEDEARDLMLRVIAEQNARED